MTDTLLFGLGTGALIYGGRTDGARGTLLVLAGFVMQIVALSMLRDHIVAKTVAACLRGWM